MKIRKGFVSNSSSTSFCLYGIYLDNKEIDSIANILNIESDDVDEILEKFNRDTIIALGYHYDQSGYGCYIGVEPNELKDEETGKEFKARVKNALDKLTGKDTKPNWVTDGWYDG